MKKSNNNTAAAVNLEVAALDLYSHEAIRDQYATTLSTHKKGAILRANLVTLFVSDAAAALATLGKVYLALPAGKITVQTIDTKTDKVKSKTVTPRDNYKRGIIKAFDKAVKLDEIPDTGLELVCKLGVFKLEEKVVKLKATLEEKIAKVLGDSVDLSLLPKIMAEVEKQQAATAKLAENRKAADAADAIEQQLKHHTTLLKRAELDVDTACSISLAKGYGLEAARVEALVRDTYKAIEEQEELLKQA